MKECLAEVKTAATKREKKKIGLAGFEPTASASRTQRSTKLSYSPFCLAGNETHARPRNGSRLSYDSPASASTNREKTFSALPAAEARRVFIFNSRGPLKRTGAVFAALLLAFLFLGESLAGIEEKLASAVVVVFNLDAPGSKELALYYAQKRKIPDDFVIGLHCPLSEEISREEYAATVEKPLVNELVARQIWKLQGQEVAATRARFFVLMRGMPLKIRSALPPPAEGETRHPVNDHDEASVDSELVLAGVAKKGAKGALVNPLFKGTNKAVEGSPMPPGMTLVCRLDGPDDQTVRQMIDGALSAEKRGLWGWAYADLRGLSAGPYYEGDRWIGTAVENLRTSGVPVLTENTEATLPEGLPVREAAVYYGWYAGNVCGPFAESATEFVPGAIAVHIHSFSAATLRSATAGWSSPLLAKGAAVTAGNVYEPYLGLTLNLDIFQDRLMAGFCVADAAYAASPALSWMGVILGDPIYRPYAAWETAGQKRAGFSNEWEQYRNIVRDAGGSLASATPKLLALGKDLSNPMPALSVACWQLDGKKYDAAIKTLRAARWQGLLSWQRTQIDWLLIRAYESKGDKNGAGKVIKEAAKEELSDAEKRFFAGEQDRLFPKPTPAANGEKNAKGAK